MSYLSSDRIAPKAVSAEIERIRRAAAKQFSDAQHLDQPVSQMRATLSNLIIVVCDPCASVDSQKIDAVIDTLCVQHPSRFFVVRCGNSNLNELQASVRSRCVRARSGASICSEEVSVMVSPDESEVVPNFLLSLLVPDIDTVLLLLSEPQALAEFGYAKLVDRLASMSDVLIYDSASFADYEVGVEAIHSLTAMEPAPGFSGATARDAAWLRLQRWQELIIELFTAQEFVALPGAVQRISLHQLTSDNSSLKLYPESALLLGWFLECLGWKPESVRSDSPTTRTVVCRDSASELVEIELSSKLITTPLLVGERIQRIEVIAGAGEGSMCVTVSRVRDLCSAEIAVSVTAEGSGSAQSCDYSARRIPFRIPPFEEIISSRIATQRAHGQRQRSVHLARALANLCRV